MRRVRSGSHFHCVKLLVLVVLVSSSIAKDDENIDQHCTFVEQNELKVNN